MQDLQAVFNRIRETKQKQKELRKMYKDALSASIEYKDILEKLENLKIRKKQIETELKEDTLNDFKQMDAYRMHVKTDMELLSDLAINKLMSGETVEIKDAEDNRYEPQFSVRFKKA
jgi:predicted phage-related endonuclease